MSNENFLYIAILVAVTAVVTAFIVNLFNAKKEHTSDGQEAIANLVNYIGEMVAEVYNTYTRFGGINKETFETDEQYRARVIDEVIDVILSICAKNNITIDIKRELLNGIACLVVEKVIDKFESTKQQNEIVELNSKIKYLQNPTAITEKLDESDGEVTISLGDFYN